MIMVLGKVVIMMLKSRYVSKQINSIKYSTWCVVAEISNVRNIAIQVRVLLSFIDRMQVELSKLILL